MVRDRWTWMMDWCMERRLPPANREVWEMAGRAYDEAITCPAVQ